MVVSLQLVGVAAVSLNVPVLVPCVGRKFVPVIVTASPMCALVGVNDRKAGAGITVNVTPLLSAPPTITTTGPVVAPAGTGTAMLVSDQLVGAAVVPLNFTVLVPCVAPNLVPVIVTGQFTGPDVGFNASMCGGIGLGAMT